MKEESLNALSRLIRKEVKAAIQEEVRDIIIEAVRVASTPSSPSVPLQANENFRASTILRPNSTGVTTSTTNHSLLSTATSTDTAKVDIRAKFQAMNPIEQMLEETKLSFSSADARNFSAPSIHPGQSTAGAMAHELGMIGNHSSAGTGIDLSSLPFLKNAKTILDLSKQKDKLKYGGN
jgi:hypothetical protein